MKKNLSLKAVVMAALAMSGLTNYAHAGMANLADLLRSPVGKFLILETAEGAAIAERILGRSFAGEKIASEEAIDALIARAGESGLADLSGEVERRLIVSRTRFRMLVGEAEGSASELLAKIAAEELASRPVAGGRIEFLESVSKDTYVAQREAFLKSEASNSPAAVDFSGKVFAGDANLSRSDFRFADLSDAHLAGLEAEYAGFEGANLSGANLTATNFKGSDLTRADLRGARLVKASLRKTNLVDADLRGAHMNGADLTGADLRGADLSTIQARMAFIRRGLDVTLKGALFNGATKLPIDEVTGKAISIDQAKGLGMVFVGR